MWEKTCQIKQKNPSLKNTKLEDIYQIGPSLFII
jgi:hypothetical protein